MKLNTISIFNSRVDLGTNSICDSYDRIINPHSVKSLKSGFRNLRVNDFVDAKNFVRAKNNTHLLSLFNAPVLLSSVFRKKNQCAVGIMDWSVTQSSSKRSMLLTAYDRAYIEAFKRLDAVYSPSSEFINYYNNIGSNIKPCHFPNPYPVPESLPPQRNGPIKVLFIGADYVRKGGDVLLDVWGQAEHLDATLTYVCPKPPRTDMKCVTFLTDVSSGTERHKNLLLDHDILILPSRQDAFGYSLLEAINFGLCTVTTSYTGAATIVENSGGFVCKEPHDACLMAVELCKNYEKIHESRLRALAFAKNYDLQIRNEINGFFEP